MGSTTAAKKAAAKKATTARNRTSNGGESRTPNKAQRTLVFETWTPEDAEKALARNDVNRTVRPTKVDQYARDMENGDWEEGISLIIFDADGRLIDGQHRCHAQIRSGRTMTWAVMRNASNNAQIVVDTGIARSLADLLAVRGERAPQLLVAISRVVHLVIENGFTKSKFGTSINELLKTIEEHGDIKYSVEQAAWFNTKRMVPVQPSIVGTAHWMIMQKNGREEADNFVHRLATLANEEEGSPVLALSRRVNEVKRNQQRVNGRDWLNLLLKTYNHTVEGNTVRTLNLYNRIGGNKDFKLIEVKGLKESSEKSE